MTLTQTTAARMAICWATAVCAMAQTSAPAFEVASIRASTTTIGDIIAGAPTGVQVQATRVTFGRMSLRSLVAQAYEVGTARVVMPSNAPTEPNFDIVATMPEGSTPAQYPDMLKTLLTERFGMQAHREQRQIVATVLSVGKNGHKLKPEPAGMPKSRKPTLSRELTRIEITDDWSAFLAYLSTAAPPGTPFLDQTGLRGIYTGVVELLRPPEFFAPNENGGYPALFRSMGVDTAERLGFNVAERKMPLEVVVVDRINAQTSEN